MFTEDFSVFFNTGEFADEAVFELTPVPRPVRGIFDAAYFAPEAGETVIDTTNPRFTCPLAEVQDIERNTFVTIKGARYSVKTVQPEGTGLAVVTLHHEDEE